MQRLVSYLMLVTILFCGETLPAAAGIFDVTAFGAKADGLTDDRPAFSKAVSAAAAFGKKAQILIPRGRYKIGSLERSTPGDSANLVFSGLKNAEIKGEPGTELIMGGRGHGLRIANCENTVFENISIDYAPLPFTQGTIEKFDRETNTILVLIDPGYRSPLDETFSGKSIKILKLRMSFFEAADGKRRKDLGINWVDRVTSGPNGLIALKLRNKEMTGSGLVGLKFAMISRSAGTKGHGVFVTSSKDCTLKNINVYSAYNAAYGIRECDRLVMDGCRLERKPGTGRLISSNADGIHAKFNRRGPIVRNCLLTYCEDDCINIAGNYQRLCDRPAPNQLIIDLDTNGRSGDEYVLFDFRTAAEIARIKSIKRERIKWNGKPKCRITFTEELPVNLATVKNCGQPVDWSLGISTGKSIAPGTKMPVFLYNLDACGRGAIIEDCFLGYNWPRGILIRAPEARIARNRFENFEGPALIIGHDMIWGEGPNSSGLQVTNNIFHNINRTNIVIADAALSESQAGRSIRDILIQGNQFEGFGEPSPHGRGRVGEVISVTNADRVLIKNNMIGPPSPLFRDPAQPYITITDSDKITLAENTFLPVSKTNIVERK